MTGLVGVGLLALAGCVADPAPVIGPASAGRGQATVSWQTPIGDNALTLTAYVVTPYIGNDAQTPVRFDSTARTQVVTGLTNGVTYRFRVRGINALGHDTAASALSNPVTPTGLLLAAGGAHTCAGRDDGSVACWGYNESGQLGNGTTTSSTTPVAVSGLTGAVAIATGDFYSCAVLGDGTARCWGLNLYGVLGNGNPADPTVPVTVTGLTNAVAIAAGSDHACALLGDGTARCWGNNSYGQLGNGAASPPSPTPVTVAGLTGATSITAGRRHTCAVLGDGTARCWGDNFYGQLGRVGGATGTPAPVTGLTSAVAITASGYHSCAVLVDGTGRCWGNNDYGQLGNGTTNPGSTTPVTVSGLTGATSITAGSGHACALLADGTGRCWGNNDFGPLGNGTTTDSTTPAVVSGVAGAVAITGGDRHSCAVLADGTGRCWGGNFRGQLGNGVAAISTTPVPAVGLTGATSIAAGDYDHSCAVLGDGAARCWGRNDYGQLGNGTTAVAGVAAPVSVTGLTSAVAITAGVEHSCALVADGTARCWGSNDYGQLGDGAAEGVEYSSATPVPVIGLSNAVAIAAGNYHACAVLADGTARCWGGNQSGQLGTQANSWPNTTPVVVAGLTNAVAITAGGSHTCALLGDGTARCWGFNGSGPLGNGTTTSSSTPVMVTGLTNAVAITAGASHTCALLGDGTARCWGSNNNGQLGNGTTTGSTTPVAVTGLVAAAAVDAGSGHTCAVLGDGAARCWGDNYYGQLGNGTTTGSTTPVAVSGLTDSTTISAGLYHSCAVRGDGTARCWGWNSNGQLGDGVGTYFTTPVAVVGL